MKTLINKIKYSRLQKEVLSLLELLNSEHNGEVRVNEEILFYINDEFKTVSVYRVNIHIAMYKWYKINYTRSIIKQHINDALSFSKYSHYKIV